MRFSNNLASFFPHSVLVIITSTLWFSKLVGLYSSGVKIGCINPWHMYWFSLAGNKYFIVLKELTYVYYLNTELILWIFNCIYTDGTDIGFGTGCTLSSDIQCVGSAKFWVRYDLYVGSVIYCNFFQGVYSCPVLSYISAWWLMHDLTWILYSLC